MLWSNDWYAFPLNNFNIQTLAWDVLVLWPAQKRAIAFNLISCKVGGTGAFGGAAAIEATSRRDQSHHVDSRCTNAMVCMMTCMTTESEATGFARQWVAAWNSHDLDAIMSHYDVNVVLISPVAAKILDDPAGAVEGNAALRNYFKRGLEMYPNLHFELLDVMYGLSSIVVCYKNQKGTRTAEFMEFGKNGKIIRVVANYSV